jgi:tryptophan-rich sensory protein
MTGKFGSTDTDKRPSKLSMRDFGLILLMSSAVSSSLWAWSDSPAQLFVYNNNTYLLIFFYFLGCLLCIVYWRIVFGTSSTFVAILILIATSTSLPAATNICFHHRYEDAALMLLQNACEFHHVHGTLPNQIDDLDGSQPDLAVNFTSLTRTDSSTKIELKTEFCVELSLDLWGNSTLWCINEMCSISKHKSHAE